MKSAQEGSDLFFLVDGACWRMGSGKSGLAMFAGTPHNVTATADVTPDAAAAPPATGSSGEDRSELFSAAFKG